MESVEERLKLKLTSAGWRIRQRAMRGGGLENPYVKSWKVTVSRGETDISTEAATLELALALLCRNVGLVP